MNGDDDDDERTPLVGSSRVSIPGEVSTIQDLEYSTHHEDPPPYSAEDKSIPPPYSTDHSGASLIDTAGSLIPHINCRVCDNVVSVEGKLHLHVIKCDSCGEATPIRPAPSGKKYVRCPCNCLLICKLTSQRIICPRPNCKRVVSLVPVATPDNFDIPPHRRHQNPTRRITCAYCNTSFLWVQPGDTYDKCPSCDRYSSFGPRYRSSRIKTNLACALILLAIAAGVTAWVTYDVDHDSWSKAAYASFAILYFFSIVLFIRIVRLACIRVSLVGPQPLQYT